MSGAGPLAFGRRLRARLRGEVPVWGLRAPARVEPGGYEVQEAGDAALVEGWACAAHAMPALDLRRRLWSGRLAELVGERRLPGGESAVDVDWFVRILGLRRAAEAGFRALDRSEQRRLGDWAAGLNAWIDGGFWRKQTPWSELQSRPRLWGASDGLLLRDERIDGSEGVLRFPGDVCGAGLSPAWRDRLAGMWGELRGSALRGPGAAGGPLVLALERRGGGAGVMATPSGGARRGAPTIEAVELLDGEPHRYRHGERWRKLQATRVDLPVRGGTPRRAWVRFAPQGGLVSDWLLGAGAAEPPRGLGLAWSWAPEDEGGSADEGGAGPRADLPKPPPEWRLLPPLPAPSVTRLVPMRGGA